jgi:hypothetical protein
MTENGIDPPKQSKVLPEGNEMVAMPKKTTMSETAKFTFHTVANIFPDNLIPPS